MEHIITTYGGGELFTLIFNGIAALFKTDETGLIMPLIRVGLVVGSVYVVILMLFKSQVVEGFKWFLWVVFATNLLFLPKTTVFIHDPLCNTKSKIDNVPYALGVFASTVSQIGRSITEKFESVFTLPGYMPYHQTGTVFASALMSQVGKFRIVDPVFKGNMERFVNQCVVYDAMIGHKYTLTDLQRSPNLWEMVSTAASPVLGFLYKQDRNPGTVVTCRDGAKTLRKLWTDEIKRATAVYGSRVQEKTLTQVAFNTHLAQGATLLSGAAGWSQSAQDILQQEMMINAIEEASNNKLSELGSASNYTATKALLQQRSAYAAAGEIAAKTLPLFKNVIEALSYALFIFIVVLALMPNGHRAILTYCGILVWTQLWAPLYAVLNLVMTLYGKAETMAYAQGNPGQGYFGGAPGQEGGLTILSSNAIINANADMTTLAAWLSVSIPFISYGILKQGAAAFVGLAQHLGSAMQSAASSAAAETVSGNISMGNVSMGTQAYQNTTAFQHNTSPSYSASQFKSLSPQGIEQSIFADGSQALSNQVMSRLSVEIMGSENTSFVNQEHLNSATSLLKSKSAASAHASESAAQDTTNFLTSVGKALSSGTDFHQGISASDSKSLQNYKNFTEDLQKNHGMTETQAAEAALAVSAGTPKLFGASAEIKGSFASSAARQQGIATAKSVAEQTNYAENFDQVISASKNFSETNNHTKNSELGNSATSSLNHAQSLREEVSIAQNQVDTISKDISSSQGKSLSINKNLTQPLLDYIAHQPVNSAPHSMGHSTGSSGSSTGKIGYEGARHILEGGGPERDAYIQRFQEENPRYSIGSINSTQAKADMSSQFDSESGKLKANSDVDAHHAQHTATVLNRGKQEANLDPNKVPESRQEKINKALNNQGKVIDQGKQGIDHQHSKLQAQEKESQDKSLVGAVAGNAFKTFVTKGSPLASVLPDNFAAPAEQNSSKGKPAQWKATEQTPIQSESIKSAPQTNSQKLPSKPDSGSVPDLADAPKLPPSTPQIRK